MFWPGSVVSINYGGPDRQDWLRNTQYAYTDPYTVCMDTRLDQPDSVATSNAKTQARQSLVYDQFNEGNSPGWIKSNNSLGESLLSVTEVSFSWSACRNFSHLRNQPPPSLSWKSCRLSPTISKLQQLYHQLPKWREKLLRTLPISTFAWRSIFSESNQGAALV